uniref:Enhancer of polycomb-like protein n=1 Tax=Kalanchoe fedtschenkoi TaxID=63787 RepID=A0A7N0ZX56_KALFE
MPAAGMRRTTRVFGIVKGGDGARVLRSGRRLWPDNDLKLRKKTPPDESFKLMDEAPRAGAAYGARQDLCLPQPGPTSPLHADGILRETDASYCAGKMFGIVYSRKRKTLHRSRNSHPCDRMYGTYYVRRKKKRVSRFFSGLESDPDQSRMVAVTLKGFPSSVQLLAEFFSAVMTYFRNNTVGWKQFTAFLSSQPIAMAFALGGISFSLQPRCTDGSRCFNIYHSTGLKPLFFVNFSSLPICFMYIHSTMLLKAERSSADLLILHKTTYGNTEMLQDNRDSPLLDSLGVAELLSTYTSPLKSTVFTLRKKRTLRRSKRFPNQSLVGLWRSDTGRSLSGFSTVGNSAPQPYRLANQFLEKRACKTVVVNKNELQSAESGCKQVTILTSCSANLLVIEADKCFRDEGAYITLDKYPTNEWFLVVKRNGVIRCCHKAEKLMRPYSSNPVTHDIIWTVSDCLKLEFSNQGDWNVFKELYKECAERNIPASTEKFIPVPRVIKVSSYVDEQSAPFLRPEVYIKQIGDEVYEALTRRNPNYDMDSEDEEWLSKFNSDSCKENSTFEHVLDEAFELIFDSLEKASYCIPNDFDNCKVPDNLCSDLCSREVLDAVHSYWITKRKRKQSMLVRVFQVHQPLREPTDHDNFQRKRKKSKRPAGHSSKAKYRTEAASVNGFAIDDAAEEAVMIRAEKAGALARRSLDLAGKKRSLAEILMMNADLMIYKAKMSIRIAEAAQNDGSSDLADAAYFFHQAPSPTHPPN